MPRNISRTVSRTSNLRVFIRKFVHFVAMVWIHLPRIPDSGEDLDGEGKYEVVDPDSLYHGKSYSDWTADWMNWFLSKDADVRNSGPVVFLRSKGLPNEKTGANISDIPSKMSDTSTLDASSYSEPTDVTGLATQTKIYVNDPNVKVGGDRLQIYDDQAIFVPIITSFWLKSTPYADWGGMQDALGLTIDYGDNPPERQQLTINQESIILPVLGSQTDYKQAIKDRNTELKRIADKANDIRNEASDLRKKKWKGSIKAEEENTAMMETELRKNRLVDEISDIRKKVNKMISDVQKPQNVEEDEREDRPVEPMRRFRIVTPIFSAIVPEAQYGRSAKDFIEEAPVAPSVYPAMVDGYFVMLKFKKGTYWVHSWASAPREARGPYFSELLYQIEVRPRRRASGMVTRGRPSRNERILSQILKQKEKDNDFTGSELRRFKRYCTNVESDTQRRPIFSTE
jgi:hypothetical protein